MADLAKKDGILLDLKELSRLLNIPVIEVNAKTGANIDKLNKIILEELISKKNQLLN